MNETRNSSQNILTKIAKNEPLIQTLQPHQQQHQKQQQVSTNNKVPTHVNQLVSDRYSTISHIETLLKNADPYTLSQMQRLAQSASLLQQQQHQNKHHHQHLNNGFNQKHSSGMLNSDLGRVSAAHVNNFKSISRDESENYLASSQMSQKHKNFSPVSLNNNHKVVNFNKHSLSNQHSQVS